MPEIRDNPTDTTPVSAGLLRRLAAAAYDLLLILALFVIPTSIVMALRSGQPVPPGNTLFQGLLIVTAGLFFIGFWRYGGQTLGMRSWRICIEDCSGKPLTLKQGLIRFIATIPSIGIFGIGILWLLFDSKKRTLPDILAGTRVVVVSKIGA